MTLYKIEIYDTFLSRLCIYKNEGVKYWHKIYMTAHMTDGDKNMNTNIDIAMNDALCFKINQIVKFRD